VAADRMKVTFHAFPGEELLGLGEKSKMITGDGVYEETWLAPHEWRREVTLGSYHAMESDSGGARKMQASSDYEPSRVLMLLNAVLEPIPRNFSSREYRHEGASGWHVDHLANQSISLVRISRSFGDDKGQTNDVYYFSPRGLLALRNIIGLTTSWEKDTQFEGKLVPTHIVIKAVDRPLLTADVSVEPASRVDPATFDLPGTAADPGTTLRPLQGFEVKSDISFAAQWQSQSQTGIAHAFSFWTVVDRNGKYKEAEIIQQPKEGDISSLLELLKSNRNRPPTIDGKPCELGYGWGFL
jgi:hypothetical protein